MSMGHSRRMGWWLALICATGLVLAAAALMPIVRHTSDSTKWVRCVKNLSQIGLALQNYEWDHGSLPPAFMVDKTGRPTVSWRVLILPYLDRDDLYRQIKLDEPWDSQHNLPLACLMPDIYRCPADTDAKGGETSYVAVAGSETLWPGAKGRRLPGTETPSSTILLVEVAHSGISWMEPRDLPFAVAAEGVNNVGKPGITCRHPCGGGDEPIKGVYDGYKPGVVGYRLSGANCLFANGAVRTVSDAVSPKTMVELLTVEKGH